MKTSQWVAATVFALSATLSAAQQKSDMASKILALEAKWNSAYQRGDVAQLNALLADDFLITVEDGSMYSKTGYIGRLGGTGQHVDVSEMTDLKVRLRGDVAIVTGAYHEKGTVMGKPYEYRDRLTDVWLNSDGRWQVIASHYSIPVKE
jgi:ketosteroid isomerase-like protein